MSNRMMNFTVARCSAVHPISKHWREIIAVQVSEDCAILSVTETDAFAAKFPSEQNPRPKISILRADKVRSKIKEWCEEVSDMDYSISDLGTKRYERVAYFEGDEPSVANFENDIDYTGVVMLDISKVFCSISSKERALRIAKGGVFPRSYIERYSNLINIIPEEDLPKDTKAERIAEAKAMSSQTQVEDIEDHPEGWGAW